MPTKRLRLEELRNSPPPTNLNMKPEGLDRIVTKVARSKECGHSHIGKVGVLPGSLKSGRSAEVKTGGGGAEI